MHVGTAIELLHFISNGCSYTYIEGSTAALCRTGVARMGGLATGKGVVEGVSTSEVRLGHGFSKWGVTEF